MLSMSLPKKSEIWSKEPLSQHIQIIHGFGFKGEYFSETGHFKLLTPGHFYEEGGFRDAGSKQKYYLGNFPRPYLLEKNDLVVAMTEQADGLLGSAALIPLDRRYLHNQRIGRIVFLSDRLDANYLYRVFNHRAFREKVRETAAGTKVKHTSPTKLTAIEILVPPLSEQGAIAKALDDADALIAAQEKLIAKKRAIKTATMQRLLTGKQRLPGFGERCGYKQTEIGVIPKDWLIASLFDLGTHGGGTTPPRAQHERYFRGGTHNWVKTLDLNNSEIFDTDERITDAALQETSLRIFPSGTILVAMYGGFQQIGRTGLLQKPAATNQAISAIVPDLKRAEPRFVLEWMNFRVDYWKSVASSSRKDPNITSRDVAKFPLPVPWVEEQRAIAIVLKDIDYEILALEKRLTKTKAIKQGMMQELLTGRTRLV